MANELRIHDFDDEIEAWHNLTDEEFAELGEPELHTYLGLTWREYAGMFNRERGIH